MNIMTILTAAICIDSVTQKNSTYSIEKQIVWAHSVQLQVDDHCATVFHPE